MEAQADPWIEVMNDCTRLQWFILSCNVCVTVLVFLSCLYMTRIKRYVINR